jgi:hypothetical protein
LEEVFTADEGADPVFEVVGDGEDSGVAVGAEFAQDGPVGYVGDGEVLGGEMCVEFLAYGVGRPSRPSSARDETRSVST